MEHGENGDGQGEKERNRERERERGREQGGTDDEDTAVARGTVR